MTDLRDDLQAVLWATPSRVVVCLDRADWEALLREPLGGLGASPPDLDTLLFWLEVDLGRAARELNLPQAEWRWDELRLVECALDRVREFKAARGVGGLPYP